MRNYYSTGYRNNTGAVTVIILLLLTLLSGAIGGLIARSLIPSRVAIAGKKADEQISLFWTELSRAIPETSLKRDQCLSMPQFPERLCIWINPTAGYGNIPGVINPAHGITKERFPVWQAGSFNGRRKACFSQVAIPTEISIEALSSMYTCTELQNLTEDLTIGGNLFLEAPISIDAIRLNVAGSAKFSILNIQAPAVVFATGDILINHLIVSSPELAPVVLVSTSGKVSIDAYQGPAVLTVISPTEVITPIGSISATIADLNSLIRPLLIRGRMRVFTH